jgi:hypothetical protein
VYADAFTTSEVLHVYSLELRDRRPPLIFFAAAVTSLSRLSIYLLKAFIDLVRGTPSIRPPVAGREGNF